MARFIDLHCQVEDRETGRWLAFRLWPAQRELLGTVEAERFVVALKARQLGWTWFCLGYVLHRMLFRRAAVLLVSQGEKEAAELMRRLQAMHERLPAWLARGVAGRSKEAWALDNGASALCFAPTRRAGRSYTASLAVIDEADYVPDLGELLAGVLPAVENSGQLILLSTSDKARPASAFKRLYRAARARQNEYRAAFAGWPARPGRTPEWYEAKRRAILAETGALDLLHQEYPATDTEALAPNSLDKRIPPEWLEAVYREAPPLAGPELGERAPAIPGLVVWRAPEAGRRYLIGADPAEGNPTSDESALCVLDSHTGEEVAGLAGRFQPSVFAELVDRVGHYYGGALVLVERNNHGHAVLVWLAGNSNLAVLCGPDGRPGWLSSEKGKVLLYNAAADAVRSREVLLHGFETLLQLQSIDGATLRAPPGQHDDRADAFALAVMALLLLLQALGRAEPDGATVVRT